MIFLKVPKSVDIKIGYNWIKIIGPLQTLKKQKSPKIKLYFSKKSNKLYCLNKELKESHFFFSLINQSISVTELSKSELNANKDWLSPPLKTPQPLRFFVNSI